MFKSEKYNLIANVLWAIIAFFLLFYVMKVDSTIWIIILFIVIFGLPIVNTIFKLVRTHGNRE